MQFYPVKPVEGGGGHLIGAAVIRRTADTRFSQDGYGQLFQNCELVASCGDAGSLDPVTGLIAVPYGAKIVRFTISQDTTGYRYYIYAYTILVDGDSHKNQCMLYFYANNSIQYTAGADINGFEKVGVNVLFKTAEYIISPSYLTDIIGTVEFFG